MWVTFSAVQCGGCRLLFSAVGMTSLIICFQNYLDSWCKKCTPGKIMIQTMDWFWFMHSDVDWINLFLTSSCRWHGSVLSIGKTCRSRWGNQKNCSKHLSFSLVVWLSIPRTRHRVVVTSIPIHNLNEETDERQEWLFKTLSEDNWF
jgi:hypothetical protein